MHFDGKSSGSQVIVDSRSVQSCAEIIERAVWTLVSRNRRMSVLSGFAPWISLPIAVEPQLLSFAANSTLHRADVVENTHPHFRLKRDGTTRHAACVHVMWSLELDWQTTPSWQTHRHNSMALPQLCTGVV
jgi:hypothetical protein